jgi:hypothetical protein
MHEPSSINLPSAILLSLEGKNMKKIFLFLMLFLVSLSVLADVTVKGYYKKNGTYVHSYQRPSTHNQGNKNVTVKGYYRKGGTYVHPYHRTNPKKVNNSQVAKPAVNPS